jgi:hypothetical protein
MVSITPVNQKCTQPLRLMDEMNGAKKFETDLKE